MEHVVSLIKSLTKREKYYFRKQYVSSTTKNFFALYEFLISRDNLTIAQVKHHFRDTSISRNIHYELNHLYKKILRVLNIYRMNSDKPVLKILNLLQHIEILIEKQQFRVIPKLLKKAKDLAYQNEEFSILIKVIGIEEYLFFSRIDANLVKNISLLEQERNNSVSKIQEYNNQKLLKNKLIDFQFSVGIYTAEPEKHPDLFENPLLEKGRESLTNKSKDLWMFNRGMVYLLTGQYKQSKKYYYKRIVFIRENRSLFSSQEYAAALNNYLFLLCYLKDKASFQEAHDELNQLSITEQGKASQFQFTLMYTQLAFYAICNDKETLKRLTLDGISYIYDSSQELNKTQKDEIFFYLTNALVKIKSYTKALDIHNVWNQNTTEQFGYARKMTTWFVIHLALDNYKLLSNELSNFKAPYKREDYFAFSLKAIVKYLRKIIRRPEQKIYYLAKLLKELELASIQYPIQPIIVEEFDLKLWCKEYIN